MWEDSAHRWLDSSLSQGDRCVGTHTPSRDSSFLSVWPDTDSWIYQKKKTAELKGELTLICQSLFTGRNSIYKTRNNKISSTPSQFDSKICSVSGLFFAPPSTEQFHHIKGSVHTKTLSLFIHPHAFWKSSLVALVACFKMWKINSSSQLVQRNPCL